jgi:hypothetical protein
MTECNVMNHSPGFFDLIRSVSTLASRPVNSSNGAAEMSITRHDYGLGCRRVDRSPGSIALGIVPNDGGEPRDESSSFSATRV